MPGGEHAVGTHGRWTTLLVRELLRGDPSCSELRAALPLVSDKAFSDRLARLREAGVVERDRRRAGPRESATHPPPRTPSRPCPPGAVGLGAEARQRHRS
ncbi:winged helix-turn-helix transcriptional regulator [Streptomyces thermolilacinus]